MENTMAKVSIEQVMTAHDLQLHVQTWYPKYLRKMHVDIVEVDEVGAVFGFPIGGGDSGLIRFIPNADGTVGVQEGTYFERGSATEWDDIEVWPDVDYYLQFVVGTTAAEVPAEPLTNYRSM
jgi:hypothetical protein